MPEQSTRGQAAAERLQSVVEEILHDVQRVPRELITWVPAEGVWSVMDILCHIREFIPFWTDEARRITDRPAELWGRDHTDVARLAAVTNTAVNDLDAVSADIRRVVHDSAQALKRFPDADLTIEATSRNPRWGVKPASFVVDHLLVQHVEKHLGQVRRNIAQFEERRTGTKPGGA